MDLRVVGKAFSVGDVVKKGARLAALDPAVQMMSVRSAQASLASAEAQLATALAAEERERTLLDQRVIAPAQFDVVQRNRRLPRRPSPRPRTASPKPRMNWDIRSSTPPSTAW